MSHQCPTCNDKFDSKRAVSVHHAKSHGESISGVEVECSFCGESVRKSEYRIENTENNYCSYSCYSKDNNRGKDNPRYEESITVCEWCGDEFDHKPSVDRVCCSYECKYRWHAEYMSGPDGPIYEGGSINYYGSNWMRVRRKVVERDKDTCVLCGRESEGRSMDVHHIVPIETFDPIERGNFELNLLQLCRKHHTMAERGDVETKVLLALAPYTES